MKETPTILKDYYNSMIDAYNHKKEDIVKNIIESKEALNSLYNTVNANTEVYKSLGVSITDYKEFNSKCYDDGKLLKDSKALYNKCKDTDNTLNAINLLSLAELQKKISELENTERKYERILSLSFNQYRELVNAFYMQVHKYMIIKGYGYVFEGNLGWICINRCKLNNPKTKIDYKATKQRKKELIEQGIRVYNKEEAEWAARNGLEYVAEDGRVFQTKEYVYEIPLIGCRLTNGTKFKFTPTDYRHHTVRGKTNEELIAECDSDINKICDLQVDIKTKLTMSLEADKTLYLNFIRNENQKPLADRKVNRQNRQ